MNGIIILLGAPNDPHGHLSTLAQERCERVIFESARRPDYGILPTGGFGPHFNLSDHAHGFHTTQYLIAKGIPKERILPWVESTNTITDAQLSRQAVASLNLHKVLVVTSDFHISRARFLFEREFQDYDLEFSGCATQAAPEEIEAWKAHEVRALERLRNSAY